MMTRDIYQLMKEMGHSKVTTTQVYSEFNTRRLETDFPILAESYQKTTIMVISGHENGGYKFIFHLPLPYKKVMVL